MKTTAEMITEVIQEMDDYLEQEYEPPLDKLEYWIQKLMAARKESIR